MILGYCLKLWPSLRNPAWERGSAANAVLAGALDVEIAPRAVRRKLDAAAMAPLKNGFLVDRLAELPSAEITSQYTYRDMSDVAQYGDNVQATRLYRWLVASWEAGRAVTARGQVIDSAENAAAYCRRNVDLFNSLRETGYNYSGPDQICLGITSGGEILHMRRGTHRMAAAHLLDLPRISARITHIDRKFAERALGAGGRNGAIASLAGAIQEVTRQTLA